MPEQIQVPPDMGVVTFEPVPAVDPETVTPVTVDLVTGRCNDPQCRRCDEWGGTWCRTCGRAGCPGSRHGTCTTCRYCGQNPCPRVGNNCTRCGSCYCNGPCENCDQCRCYGPCSDCGSCGCNGPCGYCDRCGCVNGPCQYCNQCGCDGDCPDNPQRFPIPIRSYGYKPHPDFRGTGPLFLGMELEIQTPSYVDALQAIADNDDRNLFYVKDDSSINHGFEIVSHPMDWSYVDTRFPWRMLPDLRRAGATVVPEENGLHVHLSRDGFTGPCHVFSWMKLLHRNRIQVASLARRDSGNWAAWNRSTRRGQKFLVKPDLRYNPYLSRVDKSLVGRIGYQSRYEAINVTNSATFELRMFASSLAEQEVAAALAFAASSVEYTRTLTPQQILKSDGWSWRAYSDFVAQTPSYAPLRKEIDKLCAS